ncbi:hypothetical protein PanWU01x14_032220 [Parasponia andersonii]|uniref:Endonuclease/exonuclease/phosphatase n=1 Tax=Parasponia andersonii TaxID=3476 RepID=A0A2P5DUC8_PARAD|nr:hypothetical protein PanWU01x14_032220 [Parasponia andersonii]
MVLRHPWIPSFLWFGRCFITINTISSNLTWDNHRAGCAQVESQLDCGVANTDRISIFPAANLRSFPTFTSDHKPLVLNTWGTQDRLKRPEKLPHSLQRSSLEDWVQLE